MSTTVKNLTQADIILSAQAAALKAHPLKNELQVQTLKLEEFALTGFTEEDYAMWENAFMRQVEDIKTFSKFDAPSVMAAKRLAAVEANKLTETAV